MEKKTYATLTRYFHISPTDWIPVHNYGYEHVLISDKDRKKYCDSRIFAGCRVMAFYNHQNKIEKIIAHELDCEGRETAFLVVVEFEEV